ncbi:MULTISPECIES: cell envelope integrity protein TolA [unclassified Gilliamella]|uniref:cell envelope integrity protein TolA n=1 Tax=unclassified Gilliamella TaxID=2685620 RepID=UPI002269AF4B|nr:MULTISPECIES: cell envelope integrity protein TolA [unclassified Gilliamella]MCX8584466.1 cell envelope integrity protein TolA [Gilliamella sp. B3372]MCX8593605.1 cell envelope integrity protein TolA [Gilliamella sp. B3367]
MSNKLRSKLSLPVIISIILHGILIIVLGYQFIPDDNGENYGSINGNSIDAIMIDPSVMTEQYQRQLQAQVNQEKANQQRQEQLDKQVKELAEKAAAEKAAAEKAAAEKAAAEKAAAEKAAAEKAAAEKAAAEKAAAEKAAAEKAAAEKAAAEKAAAEKAAAEKAAAAKRAEQAKKDKALNELLGGLTSGSPDVSGGAASRKGVSDGELNKYRSLVQNAISNKFINPQNLYRGKTCTLQIQIAPDGLLLNVTSKGGDADLCREALAATKLAVIPKPSSKLYNEVKTMTIDFQPK